MFTAILHLPLIRLSNSPHDQPLLIDGYKFDMRLYVLLTSCDPLRMYMFRDGLVRFTTVPYSEPSQRNMHNMYMHLTNYAVQKHSHGYVRDDEEGGTKRRVTTLNRWFIQNGYDLQKIWSDVDDVVIKTVLSGYGVLRHNYRTCFPNHVQASACFEILGFDIMFNNKLKPFVLEVNHSPSFNTDSKLDKEIKEAMLWDTLQLAHFGMLSKKKCMEDERKRIRTRLLQKTEKKEIRQMREEIRMKQEKLGALQNKQRSLGPESPAPKKLATKFHFNRHPAHRTPTVAQRVCSSKRASSVQQPWGDRSSVSNLITEPLTGRQTDDCQASWNPIPILPDEEDARLETLRQRERFMRTIGLVEAVHRLLANSPGVMSTINHFGSMQQVIPSQNIGLEFITSFPHGRHHEKLDPFRLNQSFNKTDPPSLIGHGAASGDNRGKAASLPRHSSAHQLPIKSTTGNSLNRPKRMLKSINITKENSGSRQPSSQAIHRLFCRGLASPLPTTLHVNEHGQIEIQRLTAAYSAGRVDRRKETRDTTQEVLFKPILSRSGLSAAHKFNPIAVDRLNNNVEPLESISSVPYRHFNGTILKPNTSLSWYEGTSDGVEGTPQIRSAGETSKSRTLLHIAQPYPQTRPNCTPTLAYHHPTLSKSTPHIEATEAPEQSTPSRTIQ
ncbi:tubulin polyglutamylase TTLL6/13 [Paragonimus westermani]|uniref:Tubulin polyglutamylase TTLL6/13 n=1 Tax=Paragonimus westermani TaxID=34504 RepID=A0A5J4NXD4_9TREM|nr:tubulin polyglutamylase TTLL6/13 [Paragonimus westermani]